MQGVFSGLYRFFSRRRMLFWFTFTGTFALLLTGALKVRIEEDITKFFPDDERVEKQNKVFQSSSLSEQIVVMVSVRDSATRVPPDRLVGLADTIVGRMERELASHHATVRGRVNDDRLLEVFDIILGHLPVFLDEDDYDALDSIANPENTEAILRYQYRQLIAPSGIAIKPLVIQDPLGVSLLALRKLQKLQYDDNLALYDSYLMSRDRRHILFFVRSPHSANETGKNAALIKDLWRITDEFNETNHDVMVSFFGAPAVAVGNSTQLRADTILTVSVLIVLLIVIIYTFFRDWRALPLTFVPLVSGVLFALFMLWLVKGSVSILALAAGSAIMGIAVNYALHFLVHLRDTPDKEQAIVQLTHPMTLGSLTTVLAFFCLQFTSTAVLKDIGLFAGFSLIGAVLGSLVFLPHLATMPLQRESQAYRPHFSRAPHPGWAISILAVTPIFYYYASDVTFNSDMSSLNFMDERVHEAQARLEALNPASLHTLYVATEAETLEGALRKNDAVTQTISPLVASGKVQKYYSPSALLPSDSLQRLRIERWINFWNPGRADGLSREVREVGTRLRFAPRVLANADTVIRKPYTVMDSGAFLLLRSNFFENNILTTTEGFMTVAMVNVVPENKDQLKASLAGTDGTLLDRLMITNTLISLINQDFNFIVTFTSVLVFMVLLISSGRIEITVITFMPMLITWIWILGIMALLGIEFNIVNVMVSTFIFGLGDDYSIFIMDGLQREYKTNRPHLRSVRTSILLSSMTTVVGLGVLILAEHPALRSIATIAIIGIVCVFLMSQTVEPFLFSLLVTSRIKKSLAPMTFVGMWVTLTTYTLFVAGSVLLTVAGILLKILPAPRRWKKRFYHHLICFFTGAVMRIAFTIKLKFDLRLADHFKKPGIIIANHSSFIDILITLMIHPRIVLMVNDWVWRSPVFGAVVRFAGFVRSTQRIEDSLSAVKNALHEGYSVLIFPEGTRSADGQIKRFHKGAFYLAEKLHVPIYPMVIQGAARAIPKNTLYVNASAVSLTVLPPIDPDDDTFGATYQEKTKAITRLFREQHAIIELQSSHSRNILHALLNNYRYKGPVLEWYLRIKIKLERYYIPFDRIIPRSATVADLGCGYGFLAYTLNLLAPERKITGVDYDSEKIAVAQHGYLRNDRLQFICGDIMTFDLRHYDVIVLSDVLHYLTENEQEVLLKRCFDSLNPGGKIILRDGDADLTKRHHHTRLTEVFSVSLLRFNKARNPLNFISSSKLTSLSHRAGFQVQRTDDGGIGSNVIFILSKEHERLRSI